MSTKPQRWIIQFTATRGDQTARVKMGAFGETLAHAIAFVIEHCKGQYDSMTDFAEWPERLAMPDLPAMDSATPPTAAGQVLASASGSSPCHCALKEWPGPVLKDSRWPSLEFVCVDCGGTGTINKLQNLRK